MTLRYRGAGHTGKDAENQGETSMAVRAEVHHHWAVARGNHPDRKPSYCLLHESRYNAALAPSTTPSPSTSCTTDPVDRAG